MTETTDEQALVGRSLDPTFGNDGAVVENGRLRFLKLLERRDGSIVFARSEGDHLHVRAMTALGAPLAGWDIDLESESARSDYVTKIIEQLDNKLLVVGPGSSGDHFVVARLHENGTLDQTFGTGGVALGRGQLTQLPDVAPGKGGISFKPYDAAVSSDGSIVLVGSVSDSVRWRVAAIRLDKFGKFDRTFGKDGYFTHSTGKSSREGAAGVLVQPDGRLLVSVGSDASNHVLRLTAKGQLDATFASSGQLDIPLPSNRWRFGSSGSLVPAENGRLVFQTILEGPYGAAAFGVSGPAVYRLTAAGKFETMTGEKVIVRNTPDQTKTAWIAMTGESTFAGVSSGPWDGVSSGWTGPADDSRERRCRAFETAPPNPKGLPDERMIVGHTARWVLDGQLPTAGNCASAVGIRRRDGSYLFATSYSSGLRYPVWSGTQLVAYR